MAFGPPLPSCTRVRGGGTVRHLLVPPRGGPCASRRTLRLRAPDDPAQESTVSRLHLVWGQRLGEPELSMRHRLLPPQWGILRRSPRLTSAAEPDQKSPSDGHVLSGARFGASAALAQRRPAHDPQPKVWLIQSAGLKCQCPYANNIRHELSWKFI